MKSSLQVQTRSSVTTIVKRLSSNSGKIDLHSALVLILIKNWTNSQCSLALAAVNILASYGRVGLTNWLCPTTAQISTPIQVLSQIINTDNKQNDFSAQSLTVFTHASSNEHWQSPIHSIQIMGQMPLCPCLQNHFHEL